MREATQCQAPTQIINDGKVLSFFPTRSAIASFRSRVKFELEVITPSQNLCRSIGWPACVTRTQISFPPLSPFGYSTVIAAPCVRVGACPPQDGRARQAQLPSALHRSRSSPRPHSRPMARSCPRCRNYFGVVIGEPEGRRNIQLIYGRCAECGYEIAWALISGR